MVAGVSRELARWGVTFEVYQALGGFDNLPPWLKDWTRFRPVEFQTLRQYTELPSMPLCFDLFLSLCLSIFLFVMSFLLLLLLSFFFLFFFFFGGQWLLFFLYSNRTRQRWRMR